MMQITEYISIEKQMLLDAQKYLERAEMYMTIGKPKHCMGCMIKAYKKIELAEQFGKSIEILPMLKPLVNKMLKQVNDNILKGT